MTFCYQAHSATYIPKAKLGVYELLILEKLYPSLRSFLLEAIYDHISNST